MPMSEFAACLETFFLCVQRNDGTKYPPESLQNLFRAYNRIIRRSQEARNIRNLKEEKITDLYHDLMFAKARRALEVSILDSAASGMIKKRKKSEILSRADQTLILAHKMHQVSCNTGLQKRFSFYCMTRFLIRGGKELANLRDFMVDVGTDFVGQYLEFCETTSKNWKANLKKYKTEDFREPVRCYEEDVIVTWKELLFRLPHYEVKDEIGGRYVFLQAINRPRTDIWYNRNHVTKGTISTWLKDMVKICGIEGYYTNKSCRTTAIIQMSISSVPIETGMKITGHRDPNSYKRYDQSGIAAKASAMDVLATGKQYKEAFDQNVKNLSNGCCQGSASICLVDKVTDLAGGSSENTSEGKNPLVQASFKTGGASNNSGSALSDVTNQHVDDEFELYFNKALEQYPQLKKYFPDNISAMNSSYAASSSSAPGAPISGLPLSFAGNHIQQLILNFAPPTAANFMR